MRSHIMIALSLIVLITLNYGIYEKEIIKENGEIIFLKLAPVDPRSLMQGDYMRLRYAIERSIPRGVSKHHKKRGYLVISPDKNNVAQFVRFYRGQTLQNNEKLIHYRRNYRIKIVPDSFLFQEGHAKYYDDAKYGVFKFDGKKNHLLIGLADIDRKIINVVEPDL